MLPTRQQTKKKSWFGAAAHGALSGGGMAAAVTPVVNHFTKQPLFKGIGSGAAIGAGIGAGMGLLTKKLEMNAEKKGKKLSPFVKALPIVGGFVDDAAVIGASVLRARLSKRAQFEFGLAKLAFGDA